MMAMRAKNKIMMCMVSLIWTTVMMKMMVAVKGGGLIRRRSVYEKLGVRGCCCLLSLSRWHGLLDNQLNNVIKLMGLIKHVS